MNTPAERPNLRAAVLGDLVVDVVLLPSRALRTGTDVTGSVSFRQGGSAATTARVLAAAGLDVTFVSAIGHDAAGGALVAFLEACGVTVRATALDRAATGRLGVVVEPDGERTFVADRGAILRLAPRHLRRDWFAGVALLHLPVYSLFGESLARASVRAAAMARAEGARLSLDLSSAGFLEDFGVAETLRTVRGLRPDVLFANRAERETVGAAADPSPLLALAPLVVLKEGSGGARVLGAHLAEPIEVPARRFAVHDSTGAGDAFDGGFLAAWARAAYPDGSGGRGDLRALAAAIRAGNEAARREVGGRRPELGVFAKGGDPPTG